MTDKTLSALTAATSFATTDVFLMAVSGNSRKVAMSTLFAMLATATLAAGTLTDPAPMTLTQTWNDAADTFTAIKMNVTDTASNAASLLMDLQVGGVSKLSFRKDGRLTIVESLFVAGVNNSSNYTLTTNSGGYYFGVNNDIALVRDAAATLAQRNGTTAQTFSIYNTYTNASNYERVNMEWTGNRFRIFTTNAGTGSARSIDIISSNELQFWTGSTQNWRIASAGHFIAHTDNIYDIGASGATRPRNAYFGGFIVIGAGGNLSWQNRGSLQSPSDGVNLFTNNAQTDFGRLQFGGTTSSFPAIKRSTTSLQARLADDSAFTNIQGKLTTDTNYTAGAIVATGYLTLYDAAGTAYQVPCVAA